MACFSIDLLPDYHRPMVELYGMNALIDTGAVVPTFSMPMQNLKNLFNAKVVLETAEIKGFGGISRGKICLLENFKIGELVFEKIEVFVPSIAITTHPFLLSATMFDGLKYCIDTIDLKFTVEIPETEKLNRNFFIKDLEDKLLAQFI